MSAADFFTRLDAHLGAFTFKSLEKAAGLGENTLAVARRRDSVPKLETTLAICKVLGLTADKLLDPDIVSQITGAPPEGFGQVTDTALQRIPFLRLQASDLNPRRTIDADSIKELADSIQAQGLLQNLVVRADPDAPERFHIVAGERRYRALSLLAAENRLPLDIVALGVPCRVVSVTDAEHVILALLENMQRQNVNPMEEAEALARLHNSAPKIWTTRKIAERLGVTMRHIQLRLQIAGKLSPDAQEKLRAGEITLTHAKLIAAQPIQEQPRLLELAAEGRSPEDLRRSITWDMVPASHAIFDIKKSGLKTYTDPETDEVYFTDDEAFNELQEQAVNAKEKELLASGVPWVARLHYWSDHQQKLYPEGGAGAVIVEDGTEVTIYLNRQRPAPAAMGQTAAAVSGFELNLRYNDAHKDAAYAFISDLCMQITPRDAQHLILWDQIMTPNWRVLDLAPFRPYEVLDDLLCELGLGNKADPRSHAMAWENLRALHNDHVRDWITAAVRMSLKPPQQGSFSPVLDELAARYNITVPAILRDTAKQRAATIAKWAGEANGQVDLETSIAAAGE